ncbi:MAG: hypothetical protein WC299_12175 [Kiritimatiellia bacterium]
MTTNNDNKPDNMELLKKEAAACGPGCGCHAGGPSGRTRWIVGVIILAAVGVLMARAVIKSNISAPDNAASEFASLPGVAQVPVANAVPVTHETSAPPAAVALQELGALSDLNAVAGETMGVFVFLPGLNDPIIKTPLAQMRSAAKTIEAQSKSKIGIFRLKTDSRDYAQIASQMTVPGVLAMAKGRGMVPVSGEITEAKLIQGFVAASSAGGCGAGGCGPSGCN